jgi:hypothetical protein
MIMIRSLVIVTALGLCSTSASALTVQECRDKYKAAHAAGTYAGTWIGFQETKCGINAKATTPPAATPKPQPAQRQ